MSAASYTAFSIFFNFIIACVKPVYCLMRCSETITI
jgi:hypothetical protein